MKIKAIVLALALSVVGIVGAVAAGTFQSTSYSTNTFSATFNADVTADAPALSSDGQSTNYLYYSYNTSQTIGQAIIVRFVDHDIPADFTSSDFYADDDSTGGTITNRSQDYYQGHPFTYTLHRYTEDGVEQSKRTRYIIVNQREVIFIIQVAPFAMDDQAQWFAYEDSLIIK